MILSKARLVATDPNVLAMFFSTACAKAMPIRFERQSAKASLDVKCNKYSIAQKRTLAESNSFLD